LKLLQVEAFGEMLLANKKACGVYLVHCSWAFPLVSQQA
jgi:hypothetical protein